MKALLHVDVNGNTQSVSFAGTARCFSTTLRPCLLQASAALGGFHARKCNSDRDAAHLRSSPSALLQRRRVLLRRNRYCAQDECPQRQVAGCEIAWLASIVGALSVASVGIAIALAGA